MRYAAFFCVCLALSASGCVLKDGQQDGQQDAHPDTQVATEPTPEEEQALRASDSPCIPSRTGCFDPNGETLCCPVTGGRAAVVEGCWRSPGLNGFIACHASGKVADGANCAYLTEVNQMEEIDAAGEVVAYWRIDGWWSQQLLDVYHLRRHLVPDEDPTVGYRTCP